MEAAVNTFLCPRFQGNILIPTTSAQTLTPMIIRRSNKTRSENLMIAFEDSRTELYCLTPYHVAGQWDSQDE